MRLLARTASAAQPDAGSWAPYVVVLGLVGMLVAAGVVWLLRGRTARRARRHDR